jgi:predicted phage baseplate assembly protein
VRNPLPATGGIAAEPIEEARLFAPGAFRQQIERAITAADYAELAERNAALQRAAARLAWTGSWYEADVAIDPIGTEHADAALLAAITGDLHRYRRMGHDLRVQPAQYVPLQLSLEVCALRGHDRNHVKAALLERFSDRRGPGLARGYFHPDALGLGDSVQLSRIVAAAQAVAGVECATVTELHRLYAAPNHEIDNGVLPLASYEIAQLDNDPNHPERGQLRIDVRGGR